MHKEHFKFCNSYASERGIHRSCIKGFRFLSFEQHRTSVYLVERTFRSCVVDMLYYTPAEEWTNERYQCFKE